MSDNILGMLCRPKANNNNKNRGKKNTKKSDSAYIFVGRMFHVIYKLAWNNAIIPNVKYKSTLNELSVEKILANCCETRSDDEIKNTYREMLLENCLRTII